METTFEYNLNLGLKNAKDKTFVPFCQGVVVSLTDNPNFPDVGPTLADLKTAVDIYIAAIPTKQAKNQINTAIRNEKREIAKFWIRKMGFYVLFAADNDYAKLKTSGYEISKVGSGTSTPVEMPKAHIEKMTTNGTPRQLIVKCVVGKGVRLYDVATSTDKVNWNVTTNSSSKVVVNNLTPEVTLYVKVRYRNGDHATPYSETTETRIFDAEVAQSVTN